MKEDFTRWFKLFDYSNLVVEAMNYIDKKLVTLNSSSVDKIKLRNKMNVKIVANIKRIALLEQGDIYKEIDRIFNTQLLEELSR